MAKYVLKILEIEAVQIDTTKPGQFPPGVRVNNASPTGYSYGTLDRVDLGGGNEKIDGFPISNGEYLVTYHDGTVSKMESVEFDKHYTLKTGSINMGSSAISPTTTRVRGKKNG